MTRRPRPPHTPDILVPLARCEPLPLAWEWNEAREISATLNRVFELNGTIGIMNGSEVMKAVFAVQKRIGTLDYGAAPMPPDAPRTRLVLPRRGFSPDFFSLSEHFASRRLREVLAQPPDVVEFTPIELLVGGEAAHARDYHLMRVLPALPVIDLDRSDCTIGYTDHWLTDQPVLRLRTVEQLVLRADLRPRTDLFRADEQPGIVYATDALALRVLEAGLTGIEFSDPCVNTRNAHYQRLRTPDGVRLRPVGFDGWPPPPGVHVPVLGWSPGDPPP